jgi:hypothetical protein
MALPHLHNDNALPYNLKTRQRDINAIKSCLQRLAPIAGTTLRCCSSARCAHLALLGVHALQMGYRQDATTVITRTSFVHLLSA